MATEARQWRFYSGPAGSESSLIGVMKRIGFEMRIQLERNTRTLFVEELEKDGETLGTSP